MKSAAIVYDFDGTLAKGNIQEHSFLPELEIEKDAFWADVRRLAREHDADQILIYMWRMLEEARAKGTPITKEALQRHGAKTELFKGVTTWFDRISLYASQEGLALEHYVVSSGNHELIKGCSIQGKFREIYASRFVYNDHGEAVWPGIAINYTTKTQFLFRINKGVLNSWDDAAVNKWTAMAKRPVPFERMIFIGDGDTDIPSMKMVRHQNGQAIAVYDPDQWGKGEDQRKAAAREKLHKLIAEDRANFVAPADYEEGSQLDVIVKGILGRYAREVRERGDASK
ncbi:MAG: haloacid dehalogenase-like hydrolase [Myxococcales bacterium]|nr:haloacid dehalogenase-like hydrolase [Myxococcales bacterium]